VKRRSSTQMLRYNGGRLGQSYGLEGGANRKGCSSPPCSAVQGDRPGTLVQLERIGTPASVALATRYGPEPRARATARR
jgi:hypothetical protein